MFLAPAFTMVLVVLMFFAPTATVLLGGFTVLMLLAAAATSVIVLMCTFGGLFLSMVLTPAFTMVSIVRVFFAPTSAIFIILGGHTKSLKQSFN